MDVTAVTKLDSTLIPKYTDQLAKPSVYYPIISRRRMGFVDKGDYERKDYYEVDISEFKQQLLPKGFPKTTVWGYGGLVKDSQTGKIKYSRSAPGATFEATRGVPIMVKWVNRLNEKHMFAVDPTLHWANPNNMPMEPPKPWPEFPPGFPAAQRPIPIVTHLHGGENPSIYDGHPDAWFTYNNKKGPAFETSVYTYPNIQDPTTLWYHDHALGITRLNVYAGLAGFYLLRDKKVHSKDYDNKRYRLPSGKFEIPIVIQDRMFNTDGSLLFNNVGDNPDIHPYWQPEFFGDTILVNGKVWPNLKVERRQYRFRLLNGSNARFYNLKLSNGMKMIQIGSDGGFLTKPVELDALLIAPGERADILIDFSDITSGTSIIMQNDANAPYPDGTAPNPETVGQIMRFMVPSLCTNILIPVKLPSKLNNIPKLIPDAPERTLTLNEVSGPNGPIMVLLDGQKWSAKLTEKPIVGSTEEWVIANLTMDTHPIHLHLVQFQVLDRQDFKLNEYSAYWTHLNGTPPLNHPTIEVPVEAYLIGNPIEPDENEKGWKDTVRMNPNQVTRILVRFAPQNIPTEDVKPGDNRFPFDPAIGPGYVWHCHILDHED
ncbi:MAG TPA: multicopper oxidase, partial [Mobilitalea sp.]|nr:multicopper oxidase [Mobilitalea sp.]